MYRINDKRRFLWLAGHSRQIVTLLAWLIVACTSRDSSGIDIITKPKPKPKQNHNQQWGFGDNFVEQQLFSQHQSSKKAKKHLLEILDGRLSIVAHFFDLDDAQQKDLELSGVGDVHVFMRECDKLVKKFKPDQQNWNQIWQEINPLKQRMNRGLHEEGSMFMRTLVALLNDDQKLLVEEAADRRRVHESKTQIRQMIAMLDQSMPMEEERRERLTEYLLKRVRLPKKNSDPRLQGMMSFYAFYLLASLPEDEVKSHFLEEEWKLLNPLLDQTRGQAKQVKAQFKQMGLDFDFEIEEEPKE